MKKVYVTYNMDTNEIILITEDRALAEEYMMDMFMEDIFYQWYWEQKYNLHFEPHKVAKEVWESTMSWYTDYVGIFESEVIN